MNRRSLLAALSGLLLALGLTALVAGQPTLARADVPGDTAHIKTLQAGATGNNVRALQYVLTFHKLGTMDRIGIPVTGTFDETTRRAVVQFQTKRHLPADGIVGERTWRALLSPVTVGDHGDLVKAVQVELGVPVDGTFDSDVQRAVTAFQQRRGLPATGAVDTDTWAALVRWDENPFAGATVVDALFTPRARWVSAQVRAEFGVNCGQVIYGHVLPGARNDKQNTIRCYGAEANAALARWAASHSGELKVARVEYGAWRFDAERPTSTPIATVGGFVDITASTR